MIPKQALLVLLLRAVTLKELFKVSYGIASEQLDTRFYFSLKYFCSFFLKNIEVLPVKFGEQQIDNCLL